METKRDNPLPVIILFGQTGAGKSYAASQMSSSAPSDEDEEFHVGDHLKSETDNFIMKKCFLGGDERFPAAIIDSPGFADNSGLSDSGIIKKLIAFLYKFNVRFNMVIYCLQLSTRLQKTEIDKMKGLLSFLGKGAIKNTYIMLTQANTVKDSIAQKRIAIYKAEIANLLNDTISEYSQIGTRLLIPFWDSSDKKEFLESLYPQLISLKPFEVEIHRDNFLNLQNEQIRSLMDQLKKDYNEELKNSKSSKVKSICEEKLKLIKIIEEERYEKFSKIKDFGKRCSFPYLKAIVRYFTSCEKEAKGTLINDMHQLMSEFNKKDDENRLSRPEYGKVLEYVLKKGLNARVSGSIKKIIEETKPVENIKLKDATNYNTQVNASSKYGTMLAVGTTSGAIAGAVASQVTCVALFEGATIFSFGVPAGFVVVEAGTAGVVGTITTLGALSITGIGVVVGIVGILAAKAMWTREGLIEEIAKEGQKKFIESEEKQELGLFKGLVQEACFFYLLSEDSEDKKN